MGAIRDKNSVLTGHAILAEARGDIEKARNLNQEAAQRWADYGFVLEEGQAHLGLARCLIALGDRDSATEPLHKARAIFERLGAVPLLNDRLLPPCGGGFLGGVPSNHPTYVCG